MFNRAELKRIGKYNTHKNFPEVTIIQIINFFIPIISAFIFFGPEGYKMTTANAIVAEEYVGAIISQYPLRYSLWGLLFSVLFPMIITYWSTLYYMHVHVHEGQKISPFAVVYKLSITDFFRYYAKILVTNLLVSLWTLLFIIPGFIKAYSYYLVPFIAIDQPELGIMETINESKRLMEGNKMGTFVLNCSFLLWTIGVAFSFGLLAFYVYPYMGLTDAALYFELKYPKNRYSYNNDEPIDLSIYGPQPPIND